MTRDELLKKICPCGTCDCGDDYESCNCDDCNRVLEEWLYEYDKQIRAKAINDYCNTLNEKINTDTRFKDTIKDIHDNVAREMYCKGVDDLCNEISTYRIYDEYGNVIDLLEIAKRLKEKKWAIIESKNIQ